MDPSFLPAKLRELLAGSPEEAAILGFVRDAAKVLKDNKTPFFPAYTDHGAEHVRRVLAAAVRLVHEDVWERELLGARDAAVLIGACVLHDIGMHLREDGFLALTAPACGHEPQPWFRDARTGRPADEPWHAQWQAFRQAARHFGQSELDRLLGPGHDGTPAVAFGDADRNRSAWTDDDRLLIGAFLRRHHARLAHEVAIHGLPGIVPEHFAPLATTLPDLADAIGAAARSHNEPLRLMVDWCEYRQPGNRRPFGTRLPYLMGLLRVADYVQLDADRAPVLLLGLRNPASRASVEEWRKHGAVASISWDHTDPGAIYVEIGAKHRLRTHLQLKALLSAFQSEMDTTTAVLGEVYNTAPLRALRLSRRRVHSNIDEPSLHELLPYIPKPSALKSDEDLFRLVVSDLYGDQPVVAGRELLQNAVDAVRERRRWESLNETAIPVTEFRPIEADVSVKVEHVDSDEYVLRVTDRGIGMTAEVVADYFLRAGASFGPSRADFEGVSPQTALRWMKSGRFGIGAFASFLLGAAVDVETRHVAASRGLRFTASIEDEQVELVKADVPLGTEVVVRFDVACLREPGLMGYRSNETKIARFIRIVRDHYRLTDPEVVFSPVTTKRGFRLISDVPPADRRLPPGWRALRVRGYDAVLWQARPTGYAAGAIVHNGLAIGTPDDVEGGSGAGYEWRDPALQGILRQPMVGVFDSRHRLGVTMTRYALKSPQLPFEAQLVERIGVDVVAWALARGTPHPLLHQDTATKTIQGRDGWIPPIPALVHAYVDDDVYVLWTRADARGPVAWAPALRSFTLRASSPASWHAARFRTTRTLEHVDHDRGVMDEALFPSDLLHSAGNVSHELSMRTNAVIAVREHRSAAFAVDDDYFERGAWDDTSPDRSRLSAALRGRDPRTERTATELAEALLPLAPDGWVAVSVHGKRRAPPGSDGPRATSELVAPWIELVGGLMPHSQARRASLAAEICSASPEVREVMDQIAGDERHLEADAT